MLHGVVFAHPFGQRTGLPAEVPQWLYEDQELHVFTYGRLQSTFWCTGVGLESVSAARNYLTPQMCNPSTEGDGAYWSSWKLFTTDLTLNRETLQIANLQPALAQLLAELLSECLQAVETSINVAGNNKGFKNRDRRRILVQHKKAIEHLRGLRFPQVWAIKDFEAAVPEGHALRQPTPWAKIASGKVHAPMLALKLSNSKELHSCGVVLAALRSMVMNNVKFRMCAEPVHMHAVATVGKVMSKGGLVNVYGDFRALRENVGLVPKKCVAWMVSLDDPNFCQIWEELKAAKSQGEDWAAVIAQNRFRLWEAGETFGVASASQDLRVLRVLLPEKVYDTAGQLVIPEVFATGKQLYVAFLGNVEKEQFQLKSINRIQEPMRGPLLELLGYPAATESLISEWFPGEDLHSLALPERFKNLTAEQLTALQDLLCAPNSLIAISASAGAGKSFLLGALLCLWLDRRVRGESGSVAFISTPRAKHREDLLRNLQAFVPSKQCFILESGPDLENKEVAANDAFFHAATGIAMEVAREESAQKLAEIDWRADSSWESWSERCLAVATRTRILWEQILWTRQEVVEEYLSKHLRVVLATSDKIRKHFANSGAFFYGRPVDILCADEFEGETLLDFLGCAAHVPRCVAVGDPLQALKRSRVSLEDNLPDSTEVAKQEQGSKIAPYDPAVLDFLRDRAFMTRLQRTFRLGNNAVEFINAVFPKPYRGSLLSANEHVTNIHCVEYVGTWLELDLHGVLRTSITCNFEWGLFTTIALDCLSHGPDEHVAVISFYSSVLLQFDCHLHAIADLLHGQCGLAHLENIHLLTPETATGMTVAKTHFLALQQRRYDDSEPGGQQLEIARRFVALTRAKHELWIWVQSMAPASDEWTQKLQSQARMGFQVNFKDDLRIAWAKLGLRFDQVDIFHLWRAWKAPELPEYEASMTRLRREKADGGEGSVQPASVFFQTPAQWSQCWDSMDWNAAGRSLPNLGAFAESNKRTRWDTSQRSGVFVPYIPLTQQGKTSFFVPLLWWFDRALGHYQLDDEDMFAGIVPVMQEVAGRLKLQYCVEFHKLEYEELGRQVFYAQHCHSIRGACVVRDPATGVRVAKAYLGMGTELQRWDTLSFLFSTRSVEALSTLLQVLAESYEPLHEEMRAIHVAINVQTDSDGDLAQVKFLLGGRLVSCCSVRHCLSPRVRVYGLCSCVCCCAKTCGIQAVHDIH